ncbi:hypothetical protein A4A49_39165, partial [Nicotiana attenuata]
IQYHKVLIYIMQRGDGKQIVADDGFENHGTAGQKKPGQNGAADVGISAGDQVASGFQVVRSPGQQWCDELNKESDVVAITTPVAAASNAIATTEQCEVHQYQSNLQQPSNTVQYEGQKLEGVAAAVNMANATALAGDVLPTSEYSQMAKPIATPATLPKNFAVEKIEGQ